MELNNDEFFNGTDFGVYGRTYVNGVPRSALGHCCNLSRALEHHSVRPAEFEFRTLFGHIVFGNAPDGACCSGNFGGVFFPKPFIGYKRLDLRVAKTFKTPWGHEITADFEVLASC